MRFKAVKLSFLIVMLLVIVRLFYWQILQSDDLVARAQGQRLDTSQIQATRGNIFFSDGSTLATTQPTYLIYAQPKLIPQKDLIAQTLAPIFWNSVPHTDNPDDKTKADQTKQIQDKLSTLINQDLYWVSLQQVVNYDTMQQIQNLKLPGVGFQPQTSRFYPEGSSSAHLLGFVSSDAYGNPTGYFGLEGYYNGELKGREGVLTQEQDAQGLPILIGTYFSRPPENGKTLVLHIDRTVQRIVEENLKSGIQKYGAQGASAIVMDPKTGAILAMASYPDYDPGDVLDFPKQYFTNQSIADSYEPGSTFKTLIMASAINENLVKADTQCDDTCNGPVSVGGYQIRTWDNKYFPHTTMTDVIIHSDNTGMVFVSNKLGLDKEYQYIKSFGIGDLTGIDLQDESSPDLRAKKDWHAIDVATAAFGQGVAVTPIQLIRAVATIANGGYLMEPHVVSQIKDPISTYTIPPRVISQPISTQTAKTMTDIMVQEVDKGEAQYYKKHEGVGGFLIAGKTGTAQIPVAGHYDATKTIASFVGFAPADNPKFILLVKYNQPTSSIYGADTAAPTFFDISRQLFTYYGIAPTEQ